MTLVGSVVLPSLLRCPSARMLRQRFVHFAKDSSIGTCDDLVVVIVFAVDYSVNGAPLAGVAVEIVAALHFTEGLSTGSVTSL